MRKNSPERMIKAVILLSYLSVITVTFLALFGVRAETGGEKLYGKTGFYMAQTLVNWFSFIGTCLILAFITSIILVWTTGFSLTRAASFISLIGNSFAKTPALLLAGTLATYQRFVEWKKEKRKTAAKKRLKKSLKGALDETRSPVPEPKTTVVEEAIPEEKDQDELSEEVPATSSSRARKRPGGYVLPDLELLDDPEPADRQRAEQELSDLGSILLSKLSDFNINGEILNVTVGPVVSTFEFRPASGIKVSQIVGLSDDLALAMEVTRIRIVAPLPGRGAVGVEVPNPQKETVSFKEILVSEEYSRTKAEIPVALGKDSLGDPVIFDLVRMPHLLIAGSTGSGKSQCIHTIIMSILMRFSPEEVRLLMIDPKVLELLSYNSIPHLLSPVVTEPRGAVKALKWLIAEMEERYKLLASIGVRNIGDYNRKISAKPGEELEGLPLGESMRDLTQLPYIVMIIDELADLILTLQVEIEEPLARLAQMARGVGIHLVLATQRPSVDVLTGMIKANFPSRISFRVATRVDSRTILDANGAEKLLGSGDMLFLPAGKSTARRVHGSYVSDDELGSVLEFIKENSGDEDQGDGPLLAFVKEEELAEPSQEQDELFWEAVKLCLRTGHGSTSLLQRKLKIGYSRAARIVDQLEEAGVLGPQVGVKGRDVLVDEDFLEKSLTEY
jgi:S-DNA-T family DNA segregation ATPase FtsK/SpoIIIE